MPAGVTLSRTFFVQAFPALSAAKERPDTPGKKKFCKIAKKEQKALPCRKKYVIIYERRKWISMEKYPRGRRGSPAKGVAWAIVARVQISSSPPQGVAFEHAALLLLSERCCRYRFSNKAVWNKAFRPLSYAETRYPRQLHKINQ